MLLRFVLFLAALVMGGATAHAQGARAVPVVAAASDLQFALEEAAAAFTEQTGQAVRLSFGSSGNFARQIAQGGPFELFLSADESFVFDLAARGLTEDDGVLYAIGRLVLLLPPGSPVQADAALDDLARALEAGQVRRFAIANPEHAPYGRAAREALQHRGLWDAMEDRLVLGENVSQAAQFALSGSADGGIVAYSLVLAPRMEGRGSHALIPEDWHQPLRQRMALVKGAGETARAFHAYLQQPAARAILERYGFVVPGGRQ